MAKRKSVIKSAEDKLELDEEMIDEVSNSEEFADVDVSKDDIIDAIKAIDAVADAVLEKSNEMNEEINADILLDKVDELISSDEGTETEETEETEEEEIPEELVGSSVRVMVSEDGAVDIEQKADEVYESEVDGTPCTMFDTVEDYDIEVEDDGNDEEDGVLVIGNSATKSYKRGFISIKSSKNKKAWSAAYSKVKKMVGSSKFTKSHWAIVSAVAAKLEKDENRKKEIKNCLMKYLKNSKKIRSRLEKMIKSSDEFDSAGVTKTDMGEEVGKGNPGYSEENYGKSPEEVDSKSGNPTENKTEKDHEGEFINEPAAPIKELEVTLANGRKCNIQMRRVIGNSKKGYTMYKCTGNGVSALDGMCIKNGAYGYYFKSTRNGVIACRARFLGSSKSSVSPILMNGKVVLSSRHGEKANIFSAFDKSIKTAKKPLHSSHASIDEIKSSRRQGFLEGVNSAKKLYEKKLRSAKIESSRSEKDATRKLNDMYAAKERERLFQSSQSVMTEERKAIKASASRNEESLSSLYSKMF